MERRKRREGETRLEGLKREERRGLAPGELSKGLRPEGFYLQVSGEGPGRILISSPQWVSSGLWSPLIGRSPAASLVNAGGPDVSHGFGMRPGASAPGGGVCWGGPSPRAQHP